MIERNHSFIISNQDPSTSQQFYQMLERVFRPSCAIRRLEARIETNSGDTGFIGNDNHYEFHTHIKTLAGTAFPISDKDFYVNVCINPIGYKTNLIFKIIEFVLKNIFFFMQQPEQSSAAFAHMPSPLFYEAKENDIISYQMDGQPVELVLKQQKYPQKNGRVNFEIFYKDLEAFNKSNKTHSVYLFHEDISAGVLRLGFRTLGKNAVVASSDNVLQAVTAENLKPFEEYLKAPPIPYTVYTQESPSSLTIDLDASGVLKEDIIFLIDDTYLCMGVSNSQVKKLLPSIRKSTADLTSVFTLTTKKIIDPSKLNITLQDGACRLILTLIDSPQE